VDERVWRTDDDRHVNLFWTYRTRHLEDNVTRAFVITLRQLAPVHLRLFLQDVVLANPAQKQIRDRLRLLTDPNLEFDLQVTPPDEAGDRLDVTTGLIVGVNYSGTQAPQFELSPDPGSGARPDAMVTDVENRLTVVFEIKLSDSLYQEQIQRHFNAFFNQDGTTVEQVFVEITWSTVADFLRRVAEQSISAVEQFVTRQFVEYINRLNLVEFLGFEPMDFVEQEDGGINVTRFDKFLTSLANSLKTELGFQEYGYDHKLYFTDVPQDNVWVEMTDRGITCGVVCGAGSRWRAQHPRDSVAENAEPLSR